MEKMWKSFPHVENVCGKVENMWKTIQREKCTKTGFFFMQKVEQKYFEKKSKKKKENRNRPPNYYSVTLLHGKPQKQNEKGKRTWQTKTSSVFVNG